MWTSLGKKNSAAIASQAAAVAATGAWPLLDLVAQALEPTWHEARTAGRVSRHTEILREVGHEISCAPDREDRPTNAADAKARFTKYLDDLASTPRMGLAAATGEFIDDLVARSRRYLDHLFVCFDHPRVPASTNGLEGFFGTIKATVRRTLGAKSTTNSAVANLGADLLITYHQLRQPDALEPLRSSSASPGEFDASRTKLRREEEPSIRRRSLLRNFKQHIKRLRQGWRAGGP